MTVARQKSDWDHTAGLLAKIHNVNCSARSSMVKNPDELNPYRQAREPIAEATIDDVIGAFVEKEVQ